MDQKRLIRKKFFIKRKKNYFNINENFFLPLVKILKKKPKKKIFISLYYPSFFEIDVMKIVNLEYFKKSNFLLPAIDKNDSMNFYTWRKSDVLTLKKNGIPEPIKSKKILPDVILLPLLVFDKNKNRLGYGKGFYDFYLNKYLKQFKNILTVGVAFSFQRHHNLPINQNDVKLDFIITEKGIYQ